MARTLAQQLDSAPWQYPSSQGALCQAVSGPKIRYWNGQSTLFHWFGSDSLLVVFKNKVCLKGMKISGYWRHPNNCNNITESNSTTGVQKCFQPCYLRWAKYIAAQGEYFEGDSSQWAVCMYVCLQWNHSGNLMAAPCNFWTNWFILVKLH
jgi:hypothetical protein